MNSRRQLRRIVLRLAIHSRIPRHYTAAGLEIHRPRPSAFFIGATFDAADGYEITTAGRDIRVQRNGETAWTDWGLVREYETA